MPSLRKEEWKIDPLPDDPIGFLTAADVGIAVRCSSRHARYLGRKNDIPRYQLGTKFVFAASDILAAAGIVYRNANAFVIGERAFKITLPPDPISSMEAANILGVTDSYIQFLRITRRITSYPLPVDGFAYSRAEIERFQTKGNRHGVS